MASTQSLRMPMARAIERFCDTARMSRPSRVRLSTASRIAKTTSVKTTM